MVPIFTAFDREYYARIIPHHLAQILEYPSPVLYCFEQGDFTVNLPGDTTRAVALDKAHEMCINKDLKTAVVHSIYSYLQKTSLFFNYRIKSYKNMMNQLFPERLDMQIQTPTLLDSSLQANKNEENVKHMNSLMVTHKLFHSDEKNGRESMNAFTGQIATQEQSCDTFYQTGEQGFLNYTKYYILQCPSAQKAPLRQHKLITMTTKASRKTRLTPKETEAKQVSKCLRRRLAG